MKKPIGIIISFVLVFTINLFGYANPDSWTVEKYVSWLQEKRDPDANKVAKEFLRLQKSQQEQIIDLLNNPEQVKKMLNETLKEHIETSGSVLTPQGTCTNPSHPCSAVYSQRLRWFGLFGTQAVLTLYVQYTHDGMKIVKVIKTVATQKCYNPMASIKNLGTASWTYKNEVGASTDWEIGIWTKWTGIVLYNFEQEVTQVIGGPIRKYWKAT